MNSRFSVSRITSALLLATAVALNGQVPPKEKKPPTPFVRFWNMCAPDGQALTLSLAKGENEHPLFPQVRPFYYTGYQPLEDKKSRLQAVDATGKAIAEVEISADPDQYFTVTATPAKNGIQLAVTEDTYSYVQGAPGKATIHQFVPGATAVIQGPDGKSKSLKYGETAVFEGLPVSTTLPVTITNAQGKTFNDAFAFEFRDGNRIAGLIIEDRYKRTRVRQIYSGFVFGVDPLDPPAPGGPPAQNP